MNIINPKYNITLFFVCFISIAFANKTDTSSITDSLKIRLLMAENDENKLNTLISLVDVYYDLDIIEAIKYGKEAETVLKSMHNPQSGAQLYWSLGSCYYKLSDYDVALEYFFKSLEISEQNGDISRIASCYNNIGAIYFSIKQYHKCTSYIDKAIKVLSETQDYNGMADVYSNSVQVYLRIGNSAQAKVYLAKSIEINNKFLKNKAKDVRDLSSLASIYAYNQNYTAGIRTCNEALQKYAEFDIYNLKLLSDLEQTSAELYLNTKNFAEAEKHLLNMLRIRHSDSDLRMKHLRAAYFLLTQTYEGLNKIQKAFEYQKKYIAYNDSVTSAEQLKNIFLLETKYKVGEMEQEILLLSKERALLRERETVASQEKYLWLAGLLLLVVILVIVYLFFKSKLRKSALEEELLNSRLNTTQNELTTFALTLSQKNNALELFKTNMKSLNKIDNIEDRKKKVRSLILDLGNVMGLEQDKLMVEGKINELEAKYLGKLEEHLPNMSKNEKQLAVLLRSNFTSKEIASILNISHHSVNVNRYRLRKKLNLDKGDDLVKFLNSL